MFKKYMKYTKVMIALFTFCSLNFVVLGKETKPKTEVKEEETKKEEQSDAKKEEIQKTDEEKWQEQLKLQKQKILEKIDGIKQEVLANFKKYDEKDFKVKGFTHKIYYRKSLPILVYEHKKTKAKIIFQLFNDEITKECIDKYFFRVFDPSDRGLVHVAEHCLSSWQDINKLQDDNIEKTSNSQIHYETTRNGIVLSIPNSMHTKDVLKFVLKSISHPPVLDNKELFEIEKKRVINEQMNMPSYAMQTIVEDFGIQQYYYGGLPDQVQNIKYDEVKDLFKNYIHPSNMVVSKYISDADPAKIKNYLGFLSEEYLDKFDYKNVTVKYPLKDDTVFYKTTKNVSKSEKLYSENPDRDNEKFDIRIAFNFDKLNLNSKQRDALSLLFRDKKENEEVKEYIKGLGYTMNGIYLDDAIKGYVINLSSKDFEGCKESVIRRTANKIMKFLKEKFKSFTDEQLIKFSCSNRCLQDSNIGDVMIPKESIPFDYYLKYKASKNFSNFIFESFAKHNNIFSDKIFDVSENKEFLDDEKSVIKNIRENLNVFDILIEKGPTEIHVQELTFLDEKEFKDLRQKKYEKRDCFFVPIEFKEHVNKDVFEAATFIFRKYLDKVLGWQKGLKYNNLKPTGFENTNIIGYFFENTFAKKHAIDYIYKNFDQLIKDFKLTEKEFKIYIENLKKISANQLELRNDPIYVKKVMSVQKILNSFVNENETFEVLNENTNLIGLKTFTSWLNPFTSMSRLMLKDLGLVKKLRDNEKIFDDKYKDPNMKITKEMVKEYKESIVDVFFDLITYSIKYYKNILNNIDKVKFDDVLKVIKSANLIKRDELEKLNKELTYAYDF